jgi:Zn finger protein HypA/HybF involved in hydrogenase expression|tara:strand:+ start:3088 stop:3303 length:216 start_codon:yes stop_codon:yes gene_type:complete
MLIIENDGTVGELKNWVWCEDCLDWKNTEEVSFLGIADNSFGNEILTFECDKCGNENSNNIVTSKSEPKGQ